MLKPLISQGKYCKCTLFRRLLLFYFTDFQQLRLHVFLALLCMAGSKITYFFHNHIAGFPDFLPGNG